MLDNRFAPDPEIESQLAPYKKKLEEFSSQVLGRAAETLLIRREAESKLGNFVADAMVRSWQNKTMEDQSKIRNITETLKPYELTLIIKNVVLLGSSLKDHRDNLGWV